MNATPERLDSTVDPKLLEILVCPVTKGPLEFEFDAAGAGLAFSQACLPDPRRHSDHAAGRGTEDRVTKGDGTACLSSSLRAERSNPFLRTR